MMGAGEVAKISKSWRQSARRNTFDLHVASCYYATNSSSLKRTVEPSPGDVWRLVEGIFLLA
jgi:hypothetical protein